VLALDGIASMFEAEPVAVSEAGKLMLPEVARLVATPFGLVNVSEGVAASEGVTTAWATGGLVSRRD